MEGGVTNSLTRAAQILLRAHELAGTPAVNNLRIIQVWAHAFSIPWQDSTPDVEESRTAVYRALTSLREMLIMSRKELRASPLSSDLYESAFQKVLSGCDLSLVDTQGATMPSHLPLEAINVLRFCESVLAPQERALSSAMLEELVELLNDLERAVTAAPVEPDLKSFFYDQIAVLRRALREYPVRGIAAIKHGLYVAIGEWSVEAGAADASDAPVVVSLRDRVKSLWNRLESAAAWAQTSQTLLTSGSTIVREVGKRLDAVKGLFPPS